MSYELTLLLSNAATNATRNGHVLLTSSTFKFFCDGMSRQQTDGSDTSARRPKWPVASATRSKNRKCKMSLGEPGPPVPPVPT